MSGNRQSDDFLKEIPLFITANSSWIACVINGIYIYIKDALGNITTSKRHFKPIINWASNNNLKVLKIENSSLSESGFSF